METKTCRPYLYGEHILTVPSLGSDLTDADFCWVIRDVDLVRIVEFLHSSCLICVTAIWQLRFWRTWNKCYVLTVDVTVLSDLLYSTVYTEKITVVFQPPLSHRNWYSPTMIWNHLVHAWLGFDAGFFLQRWHIQRLNMFHLFIHRVSWKTAASRIKKTTSKDIWVNFCCVMESAC